jgi:hypothetical protein
VAANVGKGIIELNAKCKQILIYWQCTYLNVFFLQSKV